MSKRDDEHVASVCRYLFDDKNMTALQVNDKVRRVAAKALSEAIKASKAMDYVPRPSAGVPGPTWLVAQGVQTFWRTQQRRIYRTVKLVVKRNFMTEYRMAKMGL